jgi:raffinose/stachyose/melibiose transport system substrate-binding protein
MKKQIISALMCVCLLLGMGLTAVAADKATLWDVQTSGFLKDVVDAAVAEFNKTSDVELEAVHVLNDQYKTKLKVVMGAGEPPDIFHNWGGGPLKEYIDAGMVEPIPEEVKEVLLERYIPASFDPATFDGVTYGVPYSGLTGVYVWYRKDTFEENGVTPPKTWSELLDVCEKLKANGVTPFALANKNKWTGSFYFMYMADRVGGGDMFSNALYRKGGVTFEDPGYVKAIGMLQDLVKKGYFPEGVNALDEDLAEAAALLYNKSAGMYLMGTWFYSVAKDQFSDMVDQLDFFPFPAVEDGKGDPGNLVGSPGQDYMSVTTTSENMETAYAYFTSQVMSDSWIKSMVENGYIPPVKGASAMLEDPIMKKSAGYFEAAKRVQVYYDQFLPPSVAQKHLDLVQALFALDMTPEEIAKAHEEAVLAEINK